MLVCVCVSASEREREGEEEDRRQSESEMHRGKRLLVKINVDANEKYVFMQKMNAFDDLVQK